MLWRKIKDHIKRILPQSTVKVTYQKDFTESAGHIIMERIPLDKSDDLNHQMVSKFLELINELISNSQKAKVELEIEFKDSILTCKTQGNVIALRSIKPKDCDNFEEIAFFNGKAFPLKEYLNDNVRTNEDIVELEKTMIRLI